MTLYKGVQLLWVDSAVEAQGVEDAESLMGKQGMVMDTQGSDIQVCFEFDEEVYRAVYVWVGEEQIQAA